MTCCGIFEKFRADDLLIKEYQHWLLLARMRQRTLGSCVVVTKEHHPRFSDLSQEEMGELEQVAKDVEGALKKLWQFDNMNWMMLMMKDKHVHFHVYPRYDTDREFAGMNWKDGVKSHAHVLDAVDITEAQLQQIRNAIAEML